MLIPSYRNLIKSGIPFKKMIILYRKTSFKDILNKFHGINTYFFTTLYTRLELQLLESQTKLLKINNINNLMTLNHIFIKKIPVFKLFSQVFFYNLVRNALIKSNKGRRMMLSLPTNGQRTWSNSKTARKINKKLRTFINNLRRRKNIKIVKKKTMKKKKPYKSKTNLRRALILKTRSMKQFWA